MMTTSYMEEDGLLVANGEADRRSHFSVLKLLKLQ